MMNRKKFDVQDNELKQSKRNKYTKASSITISKIIICTY